MVNAIMYNNRIQNLSGAIHCMVLALITLLFIVPTEAFQCYVCDSKNDIECTENLPNNFKITPQDCTNITGAKYCIKTTNVYAGELGTKRFCAANDHGNRCNYIRQPTGDREYRSCVLTCDTENCNGSQSSFERLSMICISIPMLLFTTYLILNTI